MSLQKSSFISPWCDHNFFIALKSGDHVLFRTYYSLKESNGELQSIFLMTTLQSYRARLLKLSMLPLMYIFELNDLLFFIKSIKNPSPHFDITKWIHLSIGVTRSSSHLKLAHKYIKYNSSRHFYFNRVCRSMELSSAN